MQKLIVRTLAIAFLFINSVLVEAVSTTPDIIIYEGVLKDKTGIAITTPHTLRFSIWKSGDYLSSDVNADGSINTDAVSYSNWYEQYTVTPSATGNFSVALGSLIDVKFSEYKYLQVEVKKAGDPDSTFELMDVNASDNVIDRQQLGAVLYAKNAETVDNVSVGVTAEDIWKGETITNKIQEQIIINKAFFKQDTLANLTAWLSAIPFYAEGQTISKDDFRKLVIEGKGEIFIANKDIATTPADYTVADWDKVTDKYVFLVKEDSENNGKIYKLVSTGADIVLKNVYGNAFDKDSDTTDNITEGLSNLFFTNERVQTYLNTLKNIANGIAGLDSSGKILTANLPDTVLGALKYQGVWDASTNSPAIPTATSGNQGHYYKVSVAGNTEIDGISDWIVGDWLVSNGTTWDKIDNTEIISSVNGKTGAVVLTKADLGLDKVENKTSAEIRAEIVDADIPAEISRDSELAQAITDLKNGVAVEGDTLKKLYEAILTKEDAFEKKSGFNRDFGTDANSVVRGDDYRIMNSFQTSIHTSDNITEGIYNLFFTETRVQNYLNMRKNVLGGIAGLDATGKLSTDQLPAVVLGGMKYQGVWDAATNSPAIPTAVEDNKGSYYKVSVGGTTTIDSISDWNVGDWIVSNGTTWDKIDNTETVSSVNGKIGAVTLTASDFGLDKVENKTSAEIRAEIVDANIPAEISRDSELAQAITDLKNGVEVEGDTLKKLYDLVTGKQVRIYDGIVENFANLPVVADNSGKLYYVKAESIAYKSDGTTWSKQAVDTDLSNYYTKTETDTQLATKENVFTKNTAFNKNFGTGEGTVAQGNDDRIVSAFHKVSDTTDNINEGLSNLFFTNERVQTYLNTLKNIANGIAGLDSSGKISTANLPDAVLGALKYQGVWDASTNSPAIPIATSGNQGHYYKVSVAGTTTIDGISDWIVGDWIVSNGTTWDKIDNTEIISSVNGKTGAVVLTKEDLGLTNVENKSSAEIRAEIVDADIPAEISRDSELAQAITDLKNGVEVEGDTLKKLYDLIIVKQDSLGFTPENVANKVTAFQSTPDDIHYASEKLVKDSLDSKVDKMTSSVDNTLIRSDGISGEIQGSGIEVDDNNNMSNISSLATDQIILNGTNLADTFPKIIKADFTVAPNSTETIYIPLPTSNLSYDMLISGTVDSGIVSYSAKVLTTNSNTPMLLRRLAHMHYGGNMLAVIDPITYAYDSGLNNVITAQTDDNTYSVVPDGEGLKLRFQVRNYHTSSTANCKYVITYTTSS